MEIMKNEVNRAPMAKKKAILRLSDGTAFEGYSFGADVPVSGEVVFNTAMVGYPESLTDPSYAGQLMTITFPLVGNYGVPEFSFRPDGLATFMESDRIYARAIICSEYSGEFSHWNGHETLAEWLKRENIPGITGIDTRARLCAGAGSAIRGCEFCSAGFVQTSYPL